MGSFREHPGGSSSKESSSSSEGRCGAPAAKGRAPRAPQALLQLLLLARSATLRAACSIGGGVGHAGRPGPETSRTAAGSRSAGLECAVPTVSHDAARASGGEARRAQRGAAAAGALAKQQLS